MLSSIRDWWRTVTMTIQERLNLLEDRLERTAARRHTSIISILRGIMDRNEELAAAVTNLETRITEVGNKITEETAEVTTAIEQLKEQLAGTEDNQAVTDAIARISAAAANLGALAAQVDTILPDTPAEEPTAGDPPADESTTEA